MKRTISIIGALVVIALSVVFVVIHNGNETVIVNPEFDHADADYMSLHKIERTDTATIVCASVYNLPNYWVYLSSKGKLKDSKGKTYKLLHYDGFEMDKKVYMPESGFMSFTLYFEPVDKNEKVVDYIDLDENNGTITGIKLYIVKHNEPVQCLLKGEVINRPQSSRIALLKGGADFRTAKVTYIPIHDGKFEYMLYASAEEAYELIFHDEILRSAWYSVVFIAEPGTCYFTLNSEDKWKNNSIRGGKHTETYTSIIDSLNKVKQPYYDAIDEKLKKLNEEKKLYTPEVNDLFEQVIDLPDNPKRRALYDRIYELQNAGKDKTQEGKDLEEEGLQIYKTIYAGNLMKYAKEHADIAGYTFLVKLIRTAIELMDYKMDAAPLFAIFHDVYEKKYPDHPYTSVVKSYIQADAITVGKPCLDVLTEDSEGQEVHLSELIKGKVTLVHLWASWCGPCRRHGKEMIPVYEQYKDKGFTVVGIAREQKKEPMLAAIASDKYTWVNYIELNDKNDIWTKFGIGNGGGGDFLVDAQGNFLAINTSPKEVKEILQRLFEPR
jgi:thiol-disulfide isomerase/thioredoxin